MPDYPDFCSPLTPGQVTELDPSYTSLWLAHYQQEIAGSGEWTISIEPADEYWWYKPEYVTIRVGADYDFRVLITLNGRAVAYIDARNYVELPLHANPAIDIGYGDVLQITIENLESSARQYDVAIHGLKRYMPAGNTKCPMAGFSATPTSGSPPLSVSFTDESWRWPTAWLWDFGDGSAYGTDQNPTHEYDTEGLYTVTLKASNAAGYDIYSITSYIAVTALQDLTGYTEYDPYGRLTIASTKCTLTRGYRNQNWNLYKDCGANYFDGINIDFEMRLTSCDIWAVMSVIGISNSTGDSASWASTDYLVYMARTGTIDYRITLLSGDWSVSDYMAAAVGVTYYCTLRRAAGSNSVYLDVYSDSDRLTLLDTLVITGIGSTKHRYIHAMVSRYNASSIAASGWVDHIYLA